MAELMMAPNPRRKGGIDRVIVIGRSKDGSVLRVASVDGIGNDEAFKRRWFKYFMRAAYWRLAAIVALAAGATAAFIWYWWAALIGLAAMIALNRRSQGNQAATLAKIIRENPSVADQLATAGQVWEASAKSVVSA